MSADRIIEKKVTSDESERKSLLLTIRSLLHWDDPIQKILTNCTFSVKELKELLAMVKKK